MRSKIISKEVHPNIYLVKNDNKNLLYAPFKGIAIYGRRALWSRNFIQFMPNIHQIPDIISLPTTVTIDLTHRCPLYCVYCSVDSGRDKKVLDLTIAKKTIDFVFENAQKSKISSVGIAFGGGGEPTLAWTILTGSINYIWLVAHNYNITPQILVATGGIISKSKAEWLSKNASHIALSFDGPELVQNTQRPLLNGKESFNLVVQTAKLFREFNANFSIRAAISNLNSDLVGLVRFFSKFKPNLLNFQPVVICGRCYLTGWKGLAPDRFVEEFLKAKKFSESISIPLIFPGTRIERIIPEMCHAYNGTGFVITNRGLVSACERVLTPQDDLADLFLYGKYQSGILRVDKEKLRILKNFKVDDISYCSNCFCRWHCCGGCLNDHLSQPENDGDPFSVRTNEMCYIAREIGWGILKRLATEKDKGGE